MYRLDHARFDEDLDNCIMLTNEHILKNNLSNLDSQFFTANILDRKIYQEKARAKRKESVSQFKKAKKLRNALHIQQAQIEDWY